MRIGAFTSKVGISPDWLRDLERNGRIPPAERDFNGHRRFTEEDVARLRELLFRRDPSAGSTDNVSSACDGKSSGVHGMR